MKLTKPRVEDAHIGNRVRLRRTMLGISQEKLGEACGITFQQVQKYEKGTNRIGGSRLHQIAQVLRVDPAFFFEGLANNGKGEAVDPLAGLTAEGIALARDFSALSPGFRSWFRQALKHLPPEARAA